LSDAFFQVANLGSLGFFKSDGAEASVLFDPCDHTCDTSFIQLQVTVAPAAFSATLVNTPLSTISYFLESPQSVPPPKPSSAAAPSDPADPAAPLETNDGICPSARPHTQKQVVW